MLIHIVQKSNHYRKLSGKILSRPPAPSSVNSFITFLYMLLEFLTANTSQYKYTFCLHLFLSYIIRVYNTHFFLPCFFHLSWQSFPYQYVESFLTPGLFAYLFCFVFKRACTPLYGRTRIYLTNQPLADGHRLFSVISCLLQVMLQRIKLPFCTISEHV